MILHRHADGSEGYQYEVGDVVIVERTIPGEIVDELEKFSATIEIPKHVDDYKSWYEEAMVASNEAGYACVSAADTIRDLARQLQEANAELEEFRRLSCDQPSDRTTS